MIIHRYKILARYSHGGDILPREAVGGVGDEHAGLAHRPVPHHHALDRPPARHPAAQHNTLVKILKYFSLSKYFHLNSIFHF